MITPNPKVVAAYVRISDPSREGESEIQSQKQGIREFCEKNGFILPEEYIFEEAISAYSLPYKKRPELMKLLAAAKRGEFKTVIVYKLSRIARTAGEMGLILGLFEIDYQVEVISVLDPPNQTKQERAIGRALHGILSEMEHDNIVEATMRGKRDRVRLEKRLLGQARPCFGYTYRDKTRSQYAYNDEIYCVDIDGKEWSEHMVADFFLHELLKGVPLRTIQKYLNNKRILTRSGKLWHKGTLHNMALNPAYAGIAIAFLWKKVDGKSSMRLRAPEETFLLPEGTIPPIITPEEREQILRQFELNKQTAARNSKYPDVGIMKGRVKCGICGKSCHISHPFLRGRRIFSYQCRIQDQLVKHTAATVAVHLVDDAAWELAVKHIKNPDLTLERVKRIMNTALDQEHIDRLNAQLADVTQRLKKLMEFVLDATDEDMIAMAKERRQHLEKEKRDIERLLLLNLQDKDKEEHVQKELNMFVAWCDSVRPFLDDPEYEISVHEKRQAIAILGIVATIYPSNHDPRYTIDVAPTYVMESLIESGFQAQLESAAQVGSQCSPGPRPILR
jgi:DNA invertase Pin-like site-specific DNA recombinase